MPTPSPSATLALPTSTPIIAPVATSTTSATATEESTPIASPTTTVMVTPTRVPQIAACEALRDFSSAGVFDPVTRIESAQYNEAGAGLPAHCELVGVMNERVGVGGQPYAIRYHLRLPTDWNGKFFFQGGYGTDGVLGNAGVRLPQGYAVVSTDAGHDNRVNTDPDNGGTAAYGLDPQARIDYGYNALDLVTRAAKALIEHYFGRPPERSYLVGCSNGGRQGMVAAERFPTYFDGIVAGAPGFNLPRAAIAEAWNEQALAPLATRTDVNGTPYLPDTLSAADLQLVAQAILTACDHLDDLVDGIVENSPECTDAVVATQLSAIQCSGAKEETCLAPAQVTALQKIMAGPRNSEGDALYANWRWDGGFAGASAFQTWSLGTPAGPGQPLINNALNFSLGGAILSHVFLTPPVPTAESNLARFMFSFDFDADTPKILATSGIYTESSENFMSATSTDRSAFRAHGGKMIIYHGTSDGAFSIADTINWYEALDAASAGSASDFIRLFAIPGMGHCFGGPATTMVDTLTPLTDWVERGIPPDRIVATASPQTPWPGRTRPLCPYPRQARYLGTGSSEDAGNFDCR